MSSAVHGVSSGRKGGGSTNGVVKAPTADGVLTAHICATCGTQFEASQAPPKLCPVCADDRQYIARNGQQWLSVQLLQKSHSVRIEVDDGLLGVGISPAFAIDQRALVIRTAGTGVLWEATSLATPEAAKSLLADGPIDHIAISHPHFYAAMVDWSEVLGGVPIYIHASDAAWVARRSSNIRLWPGERLSLADGLMLVRCGGHFPGSSVLHWRDGAEGRGVLCVGDTLQVAPNRSSVSSMYSYPNHIPLQYDAVQDIARWIWDLEFDNVYGYTWGRNIIGGAKVAVSRSLDRYLAAISPAATSKERQQ